MSYFDAKGQSVLKATSSFFKSRKLYINPNS